MQRLFYEAEEIAIHSLEQDRILFEDGLAFSYLSCKRQFRKEIIIDIAFNNPMIVI